MVVYSSDLYLRELDESSSLLILGKYYKLASFLVGKGHFCNDWLSLIGSFCSDKNF